MQIARLQNEKSITELVTRVYGLKAGDPRAPAAEKALAATNPHLAANLAALPAGTPVVVPAVAGLIANTSAITDPKQAAWIAILDKLVDSAEQASNAQTTGLATTAPKSPAASRTAALTLLGNDIAQFKKLHTS